MSLIQINEIPNLINASHVEGNLTEIRLKLSTDSRKDEGANTFLGLNGKRFNPVDLLEKFIQKYEFFIFNDEDRARVEKFYGPSRAFIFVKDTMKALQQLGVFNLERWRPGKHVFTLTGSNGKTTTKEMTAHLLKSVFPGEVYATEGNYNNHIGVPLTLLKLEEWAQVFVCEIGTSYPGDIKFLCDMVSPTIGFITNIGSAHIEFLGSEEGVFQEKRQLYESIKRSNAKERYFLINKQDRFLKGLSSYDYTQSIGRSDSDYLFSEKDGHYILRCMNDRIEWPEGLFPGGHNHFNMAASLAWIKGVFKISFAEMKEGLLSFKMGLNRSEWMEKNGIHIFVDCYNANPSSMETSLRSFTEKNSTRDTLFVLGDMYELGEKSEEYHFALGKLCAGLKIENVIFVGGFAQSFRDGYSSDCITYSTTEELMDNWASHLKNRESVFLKGSNSLQLQRLLDINF